MQQFDAAAAGGATQLDGTAGKGLFDAVNKAYPRGGAIHGLYFRLGSGSKSVTLQVTPPGSDTIILYQVTGISPVNVDHVVDDTEIVFGPDDVLQVLTTGAGGPIFASLYVDDEVLHE